MAPTRRYLPIGQTPLYLLQSQLVRQDALVIPPKIVILILLQVTVLTLICRRLRAERIAVLLSARSFRGAHLDDSSARAACSRPSSGPQQLVLGSLLLGTLFDHA